MVNDIEADFFALGGHSLLAMRLAAQLSRAFSRKVTPGRIMVASTVSKLSALLDSQMSDEQAQRLGMKPFCRCVKATARRCSASIRRPALPGSLASWRATSARAGPSSAFSRRGQTADAAVRADLDGVIEHHLNTLRKQQPPGPYYLFGYSLGGTLAQGIAARLREQGEAVAFLGLLVPGRRKPRTGQRKRPTASTRRCWQKSSASVRRLSPPSGAGLQRAV
ncbi:thioesterase domain-containing protein [Enterobacter hormaechei]